MQVGTLVGLWRYPVKSMAPEALTEADVSWNGIAGDRRWAFIRPDLERSGFPWLTLREVADMAQFTPRFVDPAEPDKSPALVRTPEDAEYEVTDPALAERLGEGVRVIKQDRGVFDSLPLSLITTSTLSGIGTLAERPLEVTRFRPNLVVAAPPGEDYPEDGWLGATLRIGRMSMRIDRRDPRCVIVTMDPGDGRRDPAVLRQIAQRRDNCAGVYGTTVTPGPIVVGDPVVIERLGTS
ncbi:MAG TPA: MOSC N-terminal beta barrel domain-containing protein [Solirubrobacteraceae bacterium]|jgi:hypothetical protein|nr:MOSC N-terminal beta barrel domain-containing protein [Solirubrobacteraceae bacterium]